ncbi:MAG: hypothetical protein NTW56_03460 [Alphaproteobacteria bacterium]|nr:hypothetical protein [Alphaproteobacteria bacterium]
MRGQASAAKRPAPPWRRSLRAALRAMLALALLLGICTGALAWRLAQGPLELAWLNPMLDRGLRLDGGVQLRAAGASLSWDGWMQGPSALPTIRLDGIAMRAPGLDMMAEAAVLHLSATALLRGELAPRRLELIGPRATLGIGLGDAPTDATAVSAWFAPPDEMGRHMALAALSIQRGEVDVPGSAGRPALRLTQIELTAARGRQGGLSARGQAMLQLQGEEMRVSIAGLGQGPGEPVGLSLALRDLPPGLLGLADARLLPLARLETLVDLAVELELDRGLLPHAGRLRVASGAGSWRLDGGAIPFQRAEFSLAIDHDAVELSQAQLVLGDVLGGFALSARGRAQRDGTAWRGEAAIDLPLLELERLGALWPAGMEPEARTWALAVLGGGMLRNGRLSLAGEWRADAFRLSSAQARLPLLQPRFAGIAAEEALLEITATSDRLRLTRGMLRLPAPRPGVAPTQIVASGDWGLSQPATGHLDLRLDRVEFPDLAAFWPAPLAPGARDWVTSNITAGTIRDGAWRFTFAGGALTALSGEAWVEGATVHWLAPVPPVLGVGGRAEFALDAITLMAERGRQARPDGTLGGLEITPSILRFTGLNEVQQRTEMVINTQGSLPETLTLLRHPRLRLFERRPLEIQVSEGTHTTRLNLAFPLLNELPAEAIALRAESRLRGFRLQRALLGRDLERGDAELSVDPERLRVNGTAQMVGAAVRLNVEMDLRQGPPTAIIAREIITATPTATQLAALGFDLGDVLGGSVAIEARSERRRNGQGQVALRMDLAPASLSVPAARWAKPVGSPARAEAMLRLQGDQVLAIENARLDALELSLRGRTTAVGPRFPRIEITESLFGGSRFMGDVRAPERDGAPWQVALRGPFLDLRPIFGAGPHAAGGRQREVQAEHGRSPPVVVEARFDRVSMGERREIFGIQARGVLDAQGVLRQASLRGRTAAQGGAFDLAIAPRAEGRSLRLTAENGGALIRAFDGLDSVEGGRLSVQGGWDSNTPGTALTGTAELENFVIRGAPAIGKVLQAMTLVGLLDALQGGSGLAFARMTAPFNLTPDVLTLNDWRAFSPSLGITARGRILREPQVLDIEGTIVPAYLFNQMLGNVPLLGRLFSPEPGGGVFATSFRAQGPAADPQVSVNPLSTLTPGFLRGLFGLGQEPASTAPRR